MATTIADGVCVLIIAVYIITVVTHPLASTPCGRYQFPCEDGQCVDQDLWCDDEVDCADGSDEQYCELNNSSDSKCPESYFQCESGYCIPNIGRCDGIPSCDEASDEFNCSYDYSTSANESQDFMVIHRKQYNKEPFAFKFDFLPDEESEQAMFERLSGSFNSTESDSGFTELNTEYYVYQRKLAMDFLISQRNNDFGWGDETPRALIALLLSSAYTTYERSDINMLMAKQLDVKLSLALVRNQTKPIKLTDLALYINAILSTCRNPSNFYGYDLVNTLRYRVDFEQNKTLENFVSPLVYLTLCINNATTEQDIRKLQDLSSSRDIHADRIGIQALALLATSCILKYSQNADLELRHSFIKMLLQRISTEGLPKNVYEASLLIQALNEARVNEKEWHRSEAINFLLKRQDPSGSFGDILATYYALPILSGRSMLSLEEHCTHFNDSDSMSIEVLQNTRREKIDVQYSLYHGSPVNLALTLQIQVAQGTNFLDIMRLAEEQSPNYRFKVDDRKLKPLVYSIGGIPNDAEKGMFWILYLNTNHTQAGPERFTQFHGNIKSLFPGEGDEMVFWMKPL